MARKLRVQYPGAIYHVMNRGDRREPIFKDDADEQKTERLGVGKLKKRGWTGQDLERHRKTDAVKVEMAARLRAETVMTMDWIGQRLRMGGRHTVANCLKQ